MNCEFRSSSHPVCLLGMYGGMPSSGICAQCMALGENTPEHAAKLKATPPSLPQQAASLGKSLVNWTASGFATTPPEALAARKATCRACPEWGAAALNNTGRCQICKCSTWAKLRMASERCPLGKWEEIKLEHQKS
jgi:hypothetical protein